LNGSSPQEEPEGKYIFGFVSGIKWLTQRKLVI